MTVPIKVTIGEIEALAQKLNEGTRAMDEILDLRGGVWPTADFSFAD